MPKYGAGNLPPGMVPGGGGYGSGSGIPGQNAGNYGDYGYDMPKAVRSPMGTNWVSTSYGDGAWKNKLGIGGPGSYATYLSNTGQLNNPNVYVAPGETAFAATPDYTMYEDYKNGKIQFGSDRTMGGLGHDLPYGSIYNGVNVNDPGGLNNNWGAGSHDRLGGHGGVNLENQQGGTNMAQYPNQQGIPMAPQYKAGTVDQSAWNQPGGWSWGNSNGRAQGQGSNQATDPYQPMGPRTEPYQLPMNQPTLSSQQPTTMYPGQGQISTTPGGNYGATIGVPEPIYNFPNPGSKPFGGQPNSVGPRPRPWDPNGTGPRQNYAPGQQAYNGPAIVPMNNQPGRGIGPGGPTRYVPGFNPGGPAQWNPLMGQPQPPPSPAPQPYRPMQANRPGQNKFKNTVW